MVVAAVLLVGAASVGGFIYHQMTRFHHERLTDDLTMIDIGDAPSGNVAVLRTDAGAVIVDTMMFGFQAKRIKAFAEEITGKPVVLIINTHYHPDHTHGNPSFAAGTRVVASKQTHDHLLERDGSYWQGEAAKLLPTETVEHEHTIELGGKTIKLYHAGRAHTDGDLIILFVEDRTVHVGDLIFQGTYPNIDLEAGGSVQNWYEALERVVALDFDRVIPGHGPLTDREGVRKYQAFMRELAYQAGAAAARNLTAEQAVAEIELTADEGLTTKVIFPSVMEFTREFVITRAWEEATGVVKPGVAADSAVTTN
jgi:glyoxylase-like metal-dependent hydrolase (beta-lactamase superfamily II)